MAAVLCDCFSLFPAVLFGLFVGGTGGQSPWRLGTNCTGAAAAR